MNFLKEEIVLFFVKIEMLMAMNDMCGGCVPYIAIDMIDVRKFQHPTAHSTAFQLKTSPVDGSLKQEDGHPTPGPHFRDVYIQNPNSSLVLDIEGGEPKNDARIILAVYKERKWSQLFNYDNVDLTFKGFRHKYYLDVKQTGMQREVVLREKNNQPSQMWIVDKENQRIINKVDKRSLDIRAGKMAVGNNLITYSEQNQSVHQRWKLVDV